MNVHSFINRSKGESSIFVMNPDTSECVHFESTTGYPPKTHARIPRDVIAAHQELDIRNDLIDCAIDVCSVDVTLFSFLFLESSLG